MPLSPIADIAPPTTADTKNIVIPIGSVSVAGSGESRHRAADMSESKTDVHSDALPPAIAFLERSKKSGVSDDCVAFFFFLIFLIVDEWGVGIYCRSFKYVFLDGIILNLYNWIAENIASSYKVNKLKLESD